MYRNSQLPNRRHSLGRDETHLPQGECRYLLLHPEVRGQRCACVGFSLNRTTPGSSCDCGHQACYHLTAKEDRSAEREEIEILRQKVQRLEELLGLERDGVKHNLTSRLGDLEELVDRCRAEMESEVKTAYRGIEGLWQNVAILQRHARSHDDRIDALIDANQATQDDVRALQTKVIEVDDASMLLEERVDGMASMSSATIRSRPASISPVASNEAEPEVSVVGQHDDNASISRSWTVHVSLLPEASTPFPFEKHTVAYNRALSRGLHRIVKIPSPDSQSFTRKVSTEFATLLRGRSWMPLVAKICDAENLEGLPMLRQLPANLVDHSSYDLEFLKRNCATLDANGNVLDLYIAMCSDAFSWAELRNSPPFLPDLEACWQYDAILDGSASRDDEVQSPADPSEDALKADEKPSAGDLLRALSPPTTRLKRTASRLSRTSSFGSAEGDSKRAKVQRQCVGPAVESIGRRAEAV